MKGAFTTRLKDVLLKTGLAKPETVIGNVPVGVEAEVVMVRVVEQVGLQDVEEKFDVAPLGSPDAEKNTVCVWPDVSVAVMVVAPKPPWATVMPPEFDIVKSNGNCAWAGAAPASPARSARHKAHRAPVER